MSRLISSFFQSSTHFLGAQAREQVHGEGTGPRFVLARSGALRASVLAISLALTSPAFAAGPEAAPFAAQTSAAREGSAESYRDKAGKLMEEIRILEEARSLFYWLEKAPERKKKLEEIKKSRKLSWTERSNLDDINRYVSDRENELNDLINKHPELLGDIDNHDEAEDEIMERKDLAYMYGQKAAKASGKPKELGKFLDQYRAPSVVSDSHTNVKALFKEAEKILNKKRDLSIELVRLDYDLSTTRDDDQEKLREVLKKRDRLQNELEGVENDWNGACCGMVRDCRD